ncbi:MAG: Cyclopropane-fatty-acyl-phospholipid synthase (EC, plant type [uncultured Campylobacterales bacterium]|uniref:Cyclopropane-fatty-acyl-phospholipid synthase (EC, plant type) n=1 Tax=uncultured Campylobacterales bacterium TaxID=352960 RepID=A0A6S6T4S8_9BACT|nr:MAG: Cyclopropane-fatty-acyl-phospholipid synthase (EC, plant type [uncultured Campylobacterales bacterium]
MRGFWNKLGHRFLLKISEGSLMVTYPCGESINYGDDSSKTKAILKIYKNSFFKNLFLYGDIGFGESYMYEDFSTNSLDNLIKIGIINSKKLGTLTNDEKGKWINLLPNLNILKQKLRKNSKKNSKKNISEHYDLSNDFFELILDDSMLYSSAVFNENNSLSKAQENKLQLLVDKLDIKENSHILEIGSGWGAAALYLAKNTNCKVTTVTLSIEQKKFCEERFAKEGLSDKIEVLLKDYRDVQGQYDGIISIEMFEAVGKEYFATFFKKCDELLKPNKNLVMQVITIPAQRYKYYSKSTDFIQKYIFPGGHLPSIEKMIENTSKHTSFNLTHLSDYTNDYAKTLNTWYDNFQGNIEKVKELGFDTKFIKMWEMYLKYCEMGFIDNKINLNQLTLKKAI